MARKRTSTNADASELTTPSRRRTMNRTMASFPPNGTTGEEEIRSLAYRKWEEAGRPDGDGVPFWLAAEAELQLK